MPLRRGVGLLWGILGAPPQRRLPPILSWLWPGSSWSICEKVGKLWGSFAPPIAHSSLTVNHCRSVMKVGDLPHAVGRSID